ncbi:hypothetical protein JCGZ_05848 [Jatropha curcas]|uniref:Uncharacterized protein n=1 Tax=Jatropha curcas TaxID=180498 RepID=A0A067JKR8_JATCU|nr:uncharacterized protein LOC105650642 [Jatropha curcas]KDP20079.1 hypothetical protein JCGZ_05848 [Jatropha curcas]
MVLKSPEKESPEHTSGSPKRLSLVFLLSLSSFMDLCAKHANRLSIKLKTTATKPSNHHHPHHHDGNKSPKLQSLKLPPVRPKQLLTQISNKAIKLIHHKKRVGDGNEAVDIVAPDEFGDGGVWQKEILMGDKCQPLDFSGVIYYDGTGKQINEIPLRSPRASPSPRYLIREKMKY